MGLWVGEGMCHRNARGGQGEDESAQAGEHDSAVLLLLVGRVEYGY